MLIYRRRTTGPVFMATTKNDKAMYVFLVAAICLGLVTTIVGSGVHRRGLQLPRDRVAVVPVDLPAEPAAGTDGRALPSFQIHAVAGMLLFMVWPFTRLVHAFSAPFGYLFRPYVVYRDRGPHDAGSHAPKRGWEKVG